MKLLQEAYTLMQGQSEKNVQLIVELLRTMSPKEDASDGVSSKAFRRTGLTKNMVNLPADFDEVFDALDKDVEELFHGDAL